jgi:hypothetical protein
MECMSQAVTDDLRLSVCTFLPPVSNVIRGISAHARLMNMNLKLYVQVFSKVFLLKQNPRNRLILYKQIRLLISSICDVALTG